MKKILVPIVIIPAVVLILLTVLRAWLEIQSPDGTLTKVVSVNVLGLLWSLIVPAIMLKKGLSLVQGMLAGLIFFVLHRLAVSTVYQMAWADKWTVEGSEDLVRYGSQMKEMTEQSPDMTPTMMFLGNTFIPTAFALVLLFVIWSITWAIGFRGKRPFARAATQD